MSLIAVLVILAAISFGLWWVSTLKNLNATIRLLTNILLIATAVILVLNAVGIWAEIRDFKVPHL